MTDNSLLKKTKANPIYELAIKCKEVSDKDVHIIMQQRGQKRVPYGIKIDGNQFQESVLSLASAMSEKYPSQASDLKHHLSQYEENYFLHQGAIDAIVCFLIAAERKYINRPRKLFISHKSDDSAFANELIKLLRLYTGSDTNLFFCSSVPGYEIDLGKRIFPEIKKQFDEYELLTIIIHSPKYYQSPVCLNEMGASWILETEHYSFLTADCDFSDLKGVIDDREIAVKVDAPDAKNRMNTFIQKILEFLNLPLCDFSNHRVLSRWEEDRDSFLSAVCRL